MNTSDDTSKENLNTSNVENSTNSETNEVIHEHDKLDNNSGDMASDFEQIEFAYSNQLEYRNQKALLALRERKEYLDQRKIWSLALLLLIVFLVLFTFIFTIEVGTGNWIFKDEWLVRIIYITFFASIIGLASIVINFLFPKLKSFENDEDYNDTEGNSNTVDKKDNIK